MKILSLLKEQNTQKETINETVNNKNKKFTFE
jgi:hypothetical protein